MDIHKNRTITTIFLIGLFCSQLYAQNSFTIPKSCLQDSLIKSRYKIFIVSPNFDISGWGYSKINKYGRFSIDTGQINSIDSAIIEQYYDALAHDIDSSWRRNERFRAVFDNDTNWKASPKMSERENELFKEELRNMEKSDYRRNKFDRYLFGFINEKGQKVVLILFDPHAIKQVEIGGEGHLVNIATMVYNLQTHLLNFWGTEY